MIPSDPLWHAVCRVYYNLKHRLRRAFRLSSPAADVLIMLYDAKPTRPARLAERLGMTHPNMMRMLRNLETRHLLRITPDPDHPGMLLATLTKRGQDAISPNL